MAKQSNKKKRENRPIEAPESSRVILSGFGIVFGCIFITSLWALWNSPCSWIGINIRDTGCLFRYGASQQAITFIEDGERWLTSNESIVIKQDVVGDPPSRDPFFLESRVERFALSHDETVLAVTTLPEETVSRKLVLWDFESAEKLWEKEVTRENRLVDISRDGARLAITEGETRQIWDAQTGEVLANFDAWSLAFSPVNDNIIVASEDGIIEMDSSYETLRSFDVASNNDISCPLFSPDGAYLAIGDAQIVIVFDVQSGDIIFETQADETFHNCAFSFTADSQSLVISSFTPNSDDAVATIWNLSDGIATIAYDVGFTFPLSVELSPDGELLLIGGAETAYLIDLNGARVVE